MDTEVKVVAPPSKPAFRRLMEWVSIHLDYIGIIGLMLMMLITVVDVAGRIFLNEPLQGSYEMVQYSMVVAVFFCFGHIQVVGGNISVEVVVDRLPVKVQDIIELITTIISIGLFAFVTYASILQVQQVQRTGSASGVLSIPDWPFAAVLAFGYFILTLVLISDLMMLIIDLRHGGRAGLKHEAQNV